MGSTSKLRDLSVVLLTWYKSFKCKSYLIAVRRSPSEVYGLRHQNIQAILRCSKYQYVVFPPKFFVYFDDTLHILMKATSVRVLGMTGIFSKYPGLSLSAKSTNFFCHQ